MKIVIIGAGVIGLSTGVKLLESFPNIEVVIYAEKLSPDTTSDVAAGLMYPYAVGKNQEEIKKWCISTHKFAVDIITTNSSHHKYGFMLQDLYRLSDDEKFEMTFFDKVMWNTRVMNEKELSMFGSPKNGIAGTTFIIQGTKFMKYLMDRFISKGGRICQNRIFNFDKVQADENVQIIINCSGLGAQTLCNDTEVHPIRGQIIKVEAPWVKYAIYHHSSYILPQSDGTVVLGGTTQMDNYNLTADENDTKNILTKCYKLLPGLKECKILDIKVGLRPYRSTIRLERENRSNKESGDKYIIIHNYGHGGSGLTLFWGCAEDVASLVKTSIVHSRV